jgi:hypothetical protein
MRYKQFRRHFANALWRPQNDLAAECRLLLYSCNSYVCCDLAKKHREVYFTTINFPVSYNATILLCGAVRAACSILLHQRGVTRSRVWCPSGCRKQCTLTSLLRKRKLYFAAHDWRHRPIIPVKVLLVALDWHSYLNWTELTWTAARVKTKSFKFLSLKKRDTKLQGVLEVRSEMKQTAVECVPCTLSCRHTILDVAVSTANLLCVCT